MWAKYRVKWQFTEKLCGLVPQAKELVRPWLESRMPPEKPEEGPFIDELEQEVLETIDPDEAVNEIEERITLGFQKDENGLFVRGGTIRAHIKDCANQIKDYVLKKYFPTKSRLALKSMVANRVYLEEYKVYLLRNGKHIKEEDGAFEQPVHVMTARGPRNALKIIRYVVRPEITFTLKVLEDKVITPEILQDIMEYGSVHGYGGERSMQEGRYTFTIEPLE